MTLPTPIRVERSFRVLGNNIAVARKLQGTTAAQLAERAGITPLTLRKLERGEGTANLETFLRVARSLGLLDTLEKALDPYNTDVGRLRADEQLPIRVRHKKA